MEESFSWREELKGEMRQEDQPWMRSHCDVTGNLCQQWQQLGARSDSATGQNDWEVEKKRGAFYTLLSKKQAVKKEEKERNMLVCSMQEDARREKGLENGTGNRDKGWSRRYSVGDSQGGRLAPKMSAS